MSFGQGGGGPFGGPPRDGGGTAGGQSGPFGAFGPFGGAPRGPGDDGDRGPGGPFGGGGSSAARGRGRPGRPSALVLTIIAVAVLVGLFVVFTNVYTDVLWFSQLGFTEVFWTEVVAKAALFLIAGFLVSRRGSRLIADYGGVQKVAPVLAGTFLVAGLATLSLPGLAPFISEFLVLIGTFTRYPIAAIIASGALVLSAIYILWTYQRMMGGPPTLSDVRASSMRDLAGRELVVVVPLIALLIALGVYPKPLLDIVDPTPQTVDALMKLDLAAGVDVEIKV